MLAQPRASTGRRSYGVTYLEGTHFVWPGARAHHVVWALNGRNELHFSLIDSRNHSRIRYERINEESGAEVPWDKIVKGYEYEPGKYVLLSDDELARAAVEMSRTIEIVQFVDQAVIPANYFDKPYVLVPIEGGEKGYVLLREALNQKSKIGIARVVIRTRQYMAALMAQDSALILILLRYADELRDLGDFELPAGALREYRISKQEVALAGQLIAGMSASWKPNQFHDDYRQALMKLIEHKINSGKTEEIEEHREGEPEPTEHKTINFITALQKSMSQTKGKKPTRRLVASRSSRPKRRQKAS